MVQPLQLNQAPSGPKIADPWRDEVIARLNTLPQMGTDYLRRIVLPSAYYGASLPDFEGPEAYRSLVSPSEPPRLAVWNGSSWTVREFPWWTTTELEGFYDGVVETATIAGDVGNILQLAITRPCNFARPVGMQAELSNNALGILDVKGDTPGVMLSTQDRLGFTAGGVLDNRTIEYSPTSTGATSVTRGGFSGQAQTSSYTREPVTANAIPEHLRMAWVAAPTAFPDTNVRVFLTRGDIGARVGMIEIPGAPASGPLRLLSVTGSQGSETVVLAEEYNNGTAALPPGTATIERVGSQLIYTSSTLGNVPAPMVPATVTLV